MTEDGRAPANAASRIRIVPRCAVGSAPLLEPLALPAPLPARRQPADAVLSALTSFGGGACGGLCLAVCLTNVGGAPSSARAGRDARAAERRAEVERALGERASRLADGEAPGAR